MKTAHLYKFIPTAADNDRILGVRAESNARDPVTVSLLSDSKLAVTKSVPQLDGSVSGSRNNLSVVSREGDGENVVGVSYESAGGGTSGKLPKAKGLVPGSREGISSVR